MYPNKISEFKLSSSLPGNQNSLCLVQQYLMTYVLPFQVRIPRSQPSRFFVECGRSFSRQSLHFFFSKTRGTCYLLLLNAEFLTFLEQGSSNYYCSVHAATSIARSLGACPTILIPCLQSRQRTPSLDLLMTSMEVSWLHLVLLQDEYLCLLLLGPIDWHHHSYFSLMWTCIFEKTTGMIF
jgi:hypothetical protein